MSEAAELLDRVRRLRGDVSSDPEALALIRDTRIRIQAFRASQWEAYPWQHPHRHPDGWVSETVPGKDVCDPRCADLPSVTPAVHAAWVQRGGRGTGKTEAAARYVDSHVRGPACDPRVPGGHRLTIAAPTQADAVSSCITGVSGIQAVNPLVTISTSREGTVARWPGGAVARILGAHSRDDVNRARAWTNVCLWWLEEAAAMSYLGGDADDPALGGVLDQAPFTLRLGDRPHLVITTTPANRPEVKALLARPDNVETWGRTRDAHRLDRIVREALEERYGGTTLGRQELDGEQIGDTPGALWVSHRAPELSPGVPNPDERPGIGNDRVPIGTVGWHSHLPDTPPPAEGALIMDRVVIAVDPPGGRTEAGITVIGTSGQHAYVLADLSLAGPPDTWARVALTAYLTYGAEGIAAEHTYGGDMVTDVISTKIAPMRDAGEWPEQLATPPIFRVPTKVGKRLRAEPVQALYQQHRVHHVGILPGLEDEQTTWVPDQTTESPNRIDAEVHGITYLLIRAGAGRVTNPARTGVTVPPSWMGNSSGRRRR